MLMTTQFPPNLLRILVDDGHSSMESLPQKAIGKKSPGILKTYE